MPPSNVTNHANPLCLILDEAAYHGLAGEVVRLIEPHTEADPVALLASFLAEIGAMLNRRPHLRHPQQQWLHRQRHLRQQRPAQRLLLKLLSRIKATPPG